MARKKSEGSIESPSVAKLATSARGGIVSDAILPSKVPATPSMHIPASEIPSLNVFAEQDAKESKAIYDDMLVKMAKTRCQIWVEVIKHHVWTAKDWETYMTAFRAALVRQGQEAHELYGAMTEAEQQQWLQGYMLKYDPLFSQMKRVTRALHVNAPNTPTSKRKPEFVLKIEHDDGKPPTILVGKAAVVHVLENQKGTLQQKLEYLPRDTRGRVKGQVVTKPKEPTKPEVPPASATDGEKVAGGADAHASTPESLVQAAKMQGIHALGEAIRKLEPDWIDTILKAVSTRLFTLKQDRYTELAKQIEACIDASPDAIKPRRGAEKKVA